MSTVLAVDDERHLLSMYERLFRHVGFDVVTAASVDEARRRLQETSVDVMVTDWMLPDGDGGDLVREARTRPSPIPSVLVTGLGVEKAKEAADAVGANRFFAKPFNIVALTMAVRELACSSPVSPVLPGHLCSCPTF